MARVRDLWFTAGRRKTARHPDRGGDSNSKRWLAVWVVEGREHTKAFRVKAHAERHATDMQSDIDRGEYLDPAAGRAPLDVLAHKWLRLRECSAGTRQRYESCYRLHVKPSFGNRQAGTVRPSEIAAWSRGMADHPVTRGMAVMILSGIFDLAQADGVRRDNPARASVVARPSQKRGNAERDAWDAERVHAVARACRDWSALPLVAAGLGLREGELFGLAAEDVDVDGGVVQVRRQVTRVGPVFAAKLPKGGKTRVVPLPRGVAALLSGVAGLAPVTLPWLTEAATVGRKPATFTPLWLWHDGQPIKAWAWHRYVWYPALAAAGVIPEYKGRNYPPAREHGMHALRHFYSSCLQDSGVSLAGVMEFLGHSRKSAPLAVGVYGHVTDATFEAARNAVDQVLFRPRVVPSNGTVAELSAVR